VWTLIYQQGENYWLSPKLSAETMSINGGVAFGSALAGGAIAGPMGAFMALPFAALITSIISNSGKTYAVVYASTYGEESPGGDNPAVDDSHIQHRHRRTRHLAGRGVAARRRLSSPTMEATSDEPA
jgi:hypothetical protein